MRIRSSIALGALAALIAMAPSSPQAEEERPRVRCGKKYMTVWATGGNVEKGPVVFPKSAVRAIYVSDTDKQLTIWIDMGPKILTPTITLDTLRSILDCLD